MRQDRTSRSARSGRPWSGADVGRLAVMAERQIPLDRIARKLRRSEGAVKAEAARRRIRLAATEKPAYRAASPRSTLVKPGHAPGRPSERSSSPSLF